MIIKVKDLIASLSKFNNPEDLIFATWFSKEEADEANDFALTDEQWQKVMSAMESASDAFVEIELCTALDNIWQES